MFCKYLTMYQVIIKISVIDSKTPELMLEVPQGCDHSQTCLQITAIKTRFSKSSDMVNLWKKKTDPDSFYNKFL